MLFRSGSLAKFHQGNNIQPMDLAETARAIEHLNNCFGADISDAKVFVLEFGKTFEVEHPVREYLSLLGTVPDRKSACRERVCPYV